MDLRFRIWDSGSGNRKKPIWIPDSGPKKHRIPDPQHWSELSSVPFANSKTVKKTFWADLIDKLVMEVRNLQVGQAPSRLSLNIIIIFNFYSTKIISNNGSWKKTLPVCGGNLTIYIPQSPVPTVDLFGKLDKTYLKRVAWKNQTGNEGLTIWFRIHEKNEKKFGKSTPVTSNTDFRHER
jgi:hypothetical protein